MPLPSNHARPVGSPRSRRQAAFLLRGATIMLVLACVISSCARPAERTNNTPVAPSTLRTVVDYPVVWFDTPHLDLDTPDGTFVRAIFESYILRSELGASAYFPGWDEATGDSWYNWGDRPGYGPRNNPPFTIFAWVAPFIDPDPAGISDWTPPSDTVGAVIVCSRNSVGNDYAMIYTYQRTGTAPPADQHGNQPTPNRNVYGDWTILDSVTSSAGIHIDRTERCDTPPAPISQDIHTPSPGWPASSE
ncbi:UNVERIFIED_CONTAM: hypothetical protein DES50_10176 [Williamsia faeni]